MDGIDWSEKSEVKYETWAENRARRAQKEEDSIRERREQRREEAYHHYRPWTRSSWSPSVRRTFSPPKGEHKTASSCKPQETMVPSMASPTVSSRKLEDAMDGDTHMDDVDGKRCGYSLSLPLPYACFSIASACTRTYLHVSLASIATAWAVGLVTHQVCSYDVAVMMGREEIHPS